MEFLSVKQAAALLGLYPDTVRDIPNDLLPVTRTAGKHRRYKRRDIEAYMLYCAAPDETVDVQEDYLDTDIAAFYSFCVDIFAEREGISVQDSENVFERTKLFDFIRVCFGALHTQGEFYILGTIYEYLDSHGYAQEHSHKVADFFDLEVIE